MHDRARAWPLVRCPLGLLRLAGGWLLALVLLAGAGAPPAAESALAAAAVSAVSAGAGAPKLRPLPAALERRMPELVRAAERYRGLKLERRGALGRAAPPPAAPRRGGAARRGPPP